MAKVKPITRLDSYRLVRYVLLLFYVQSILVGFTAQVYDSTKNRIYTSKILAFYSIGISIILIIKHITSGNLIGRNSELGVVESTVNAVEAFLLLNIMLLGTIRRYTMRKNIESLFDDYANIQKVIGFTSSQIYGTANIRVMRAAMIGTALLLILILPELRTVTSVSEVFDVFTLMYPKVMIVNLASWQYLEVLYVHRYLELINHMLSEMHYEAAKEVKVINLDKNFQSLSLKLFRIMMIRNRVIALAFKINNNNNLQMLTVFTLISVLTLNQMYAVFLLIHHLSQDQIEESQQKSLSSIFCLILILYEAFCITDACEQVVEESNKTSEILHRYNSLHMDAQLKQTVEMFLIQLMHHPIKFTACGMFTLDYSVLFSIITSATSYLIILIQFELADNCKKG
ncbi:putative gustatory receptor 58a isoform X1 [Aedes aegypti]|uniref:Gustatory receptor n=1 Tax=Aedes aegypti TaxID=7159 RepID=A0A1S4G665_AEDAE|nr:gustatory receptor 33a isoform 1 [Aedes aegypti]